MVPGGRAVSGSRWDDDLSPQMQTVSLDPLRIAVQAHASELLGATVGGSTSLRYLAESLTYELEAFLLTDRLPPERIEDTQRVEVLFPDGWVEMLRHTYRERWWMRWWVARRPIRWHTEVRVARLEVELRRFWSFPKSSIRLPNDRLGEPVRLAQWDTRGSVQ